MSHGTTILPDVQSAGTIDTHRCLGSPVCRWWPWHRKRE